jgi:hypothetical protein
MRPRAVIEVRRDEDSGRDQVQVVSRGSRVRTEELPPGERVVDIPLAPLGVHEVRAWAHQVDAGGKSESLPMTASIRGPDGDVPQDVRDGALVLDIQGDIQGDLQGDGQTLEMRLPRVSAGGRR